MKASILAGSAILAMISGLALAGDTPEFSTADVNEDGVLSKMEADAALPQLTIPDTDRDGVISKSEVRTVLPDVEFQVGDASAVGEEEYQQIVQVVEDLMAEEA